MRVENLKKWWMFDGISFALFLVAMATIVAVKVTESAPVVLAVMLGGIAAVWVISKALRSR